MMTSPFAGEPAYCSRFLNRFLSVRNGCLAYHHRGSRYQHGWVHRSRRASPGSGFSRQPMQGSTCVAFVRFVAFATGAVRPAY